MQKLSGPVGRSPTSPKRRSWHGCGIAAMAWQLVRRPAPAPARFGSFWKGTEISAHAARLTPSPSPMHGIVSPVWDQEAGASRGTAAASSDQRERDAPTTTGLWSDVSCCRMPACPAWQTGPFLPDLHAYVSPMAVSDTITPCTYKDPHARTRPLGLHPTTTKKKTFQSSPLHRILRHMHGALNIDEKQKLIT